MLKHHSILLSWLSLPLLATGSAACGSPDTSTSESRDLTEQASDAQSFRDIFYTYVKSDHGLSDEDVRKLVFLPTRDVISPPVSVAGGDNPVAAHDAYFREKGTSPSALYEHGVAAPLEEIPGLEAELKAHGPVTIVVFPGIFGEFIERPPFQEVLAKGPETALGKAWARKLREHASPDDVSDSAFSLKALAEETLPIADLLDVASIDDGEGNPLVHVVFLKGKTGSLETVGKIDDWRDYHLRRMTKFFNVMGTPDRFYLLGYSRGTMLALNALSAAAGDRQRYPWVDHVEGLIGLGGVVYGTQVADQLLEPGSPLNQLLVTVEGLTDALESCDPDENLASRFTKMRANTGRWAGAATRADELVAAASQHPELELEDLGRISPDFGGLLRTINRLVFKDVIRLDRPVSQYCKNVERFKRLVHAIADGALELTTPSRLDWWRTHTVPSELKYLAMAATMGDPSSEGRVWPLTMNDVAYTPGSIDYRALRTGYYDLYKMTGIQLNDSQVAYTRARFWPEVHAALNPQQGPIDAHFLALFGQDHWGMALPRVVEESSGALSPFPRTALLKAVATFVARTE